jgi:hypothetical protein
LNTGLVAQYEIKQEVLSAPCRQQLFTTLAEIFAKPVRNEVVNGAERKRRRPQGGKVKLQKVLTDSTHGIALEALNTKFGTGIQNNFGIFLTKEDYEMHLALTKSNRAPDASLRLKILPISRDFDIPNQEWLLYIRQRLLLPLVPVNELPEKCQLCKIALPPHNRLVSFHFLGCREFKGYEKWWNHESALGEFLKYLKLNHIGKNVNSQAYRVLPDPSSPYPLNQKGKRPDCEVFLGTRKIAIDISITSNACFSKISAAAKSDDVNYANLTREKEKVAKYIEVCRAHGLEFTPTILSLWGGIGKCFTKLIDDCWKHSNSKMYPPHLLRQKLQLSLSHSAYVLFKATFLAGKFGQMRPRAINRSNVHFRNNAHVNIGGLGTHNRLPMFVAGRNLNVLPLHDLGQNFSAPTLDDLDRDIKEHKIDSPSGVSSSSASNFMSDLVITGISSSSSSSSVTANFSDLKSDYVTITGVGTQGVSTNRKRPRSASVDSPNDHSFSPPAARRNFIDFTDPIATQQFINSFGLMPSSSVSAFLGSPSSPGLFPSLLDNVLPRQASSSDPSNSSVSDDHDSVVPVSSLGSVINN